MGVPRGDRPLHLLTTDALSPLRRGPPPTTSMAHQPAHQIRGFPTSKEACHVRRGVTATPTFFYQFGGHVGYADEEELLELIEGSR